MKRTFEEDLKLATEWHGHTCAGQVIGTRLARLGLALFGLEGFEDAREIVAFVENDRCLADAVVVVMGCHPGKRRLKMMDYGKMAATFFSTETGMAYRIAVREVGQCGKDDDPVEFFSKFTDEEMFTVQQVEVDLDGVTLPGQPSNRIECEGCGERVVDNRYILKDGRKLCRACAGADIYYSPIDAPVDIPII